MAPPAAASGAVQAELSADGPVLGVDPGSRLLGLAVIVPEGRRGSRLLAAETLRLPPALSLAQRLGRILVEVEDWLGRYRPVVLAIEESFVRRNVATALVLGQTRGAVIAACARAGLPVFEYPPSRIKQTVVGSGRADKAQVQLMVSRLLDLPATLPPDAADAAAVALCHQQHRLPMATQLGIDGSAGRYRRGRSGGRGLRWANLPGQG